jgi:hypothetical protein
MNANKGVERHRAKLLKKELDSWKKTVPGQSVNMGFNKPKRRRSKIWRRKPRGM